MAKLFPITRYTKDRLQRPYKVYIPWEVGIKAGRVYERYYSQTAERVAERGGFDEGELACLMADHNPWGCQTHEACIAKLNLDALIVERD